MQNFKEYLGDSVYANFNGYYIILSLDNGEGDYNFIALEPQVLENLLKYKERIDNERRENFPDYQQPS